MPLTYFPSVLLDKEGDVVAALGGVGEAEGHALHHEYLAREGEPDACASLLGGEEGNEDFVSDIEWNDVAVVGEIEASLSPSKGGVNNSLSFGEGWGEADRFCFCFDGVFNYINEDLA